ncbi:MAG: biopolymer transporter ExbD [Cyclobacteriaceae bacterium]
MKKTPKQIEVNTGSMADIAFLLLIFFLVSTTILQHRGVSIKLPPDAKNQPIHQVHDRNLFKILINANNELLVEDKVWDDIAGLKKEVKAFIMNVNGDLNLSESPEDAIVSLKTSRGTNYKTFIAVLDELKAAYYEIYAERVNLTSKEFRSLDLDKIEQKEVYNRARRGVPMNISLAEPTI